MTALEQFALSVLEETRIELTDLDGAWLQDKAESLGLLVRVKADSPCGDICRCAEYYAVDEWPVECLRYSKHVVKLRKRLLWP